jgi:hypothetical protein
MKECIIAGASTVAQIMHVHYAEGGEPDETVAAGFDEGEC